MPPKYHLVRKLAFTSYLLAFALPVYVFFSRRFSALEAPLDVQVAFTLFFPLAGLFAFTLLSLQLIIGANLRLWRIYFPDILNFHRRQGLIAAIFVLLHPLMIASAFGLDTMAKGQLVSADQRLYLVLAWLALLVLALTIGSAVIAWKLQRLTKLWRYLHLANYLAFAFTWLHSWFLGSDIRPTGLRYLWLFYAFLALLSVVLRLKRHLVLSWLARQRQTTL
jgi:DMSO/TMAO reductase YedYZ heme-binding membrane subunit